MFLHNHHTPNPLIYGEFDNDILRANGTLQINNPAGKNSTLRMQGNGGSYNEVIRYDSVFNDVIIGSVSGSGGKLLLRSNGRTQMIMIENGDVGIGTNSPSQKLHVEGSVYVNGTITTEGSADIRNQLKIGNLPTNGTTDLRINSIGVVSTSSSDARLKKEIHTVQDALTSVLALRGVTFEWISDPEAGTQLGVIAQEVQEVVPELVTHSGGYLGVDYSEMSALFIEAIKEQQEIINDLRVRIAVLERSKSSATQLHRAAESSKEE